MRLNHSFRRNDSLLQKCADVVEALIAAAFLEGQGSLRLPMLVLKKIDFHLPHFRQVAAIAENAGHLDPDPGHDRAPELGPAHIKPSISPTRALKTSDGPLASAETWLDQIAAIIGHRMSTCRDAYKVSSTTCVVTEP